MEKKGKNETLMSNQQVPTNGSNVVNLDDPMRNDTDNQN